MLVRSSTLFLPGQKVAQAGLLLVRRFCCYIHFKLLSTEHVFRLLISYHSRRYIGIHCRGRATGLGAFLLFLFILGQPASTGWASALR